MADHKRKFCIAGPIDPARHYFIRHRLMTDYIFTFIEDQEYFVLHAPRQSGKTSAIDELAREITKRGKYATLYINVEAAQAARDNIEKALITIVHILAREIDKQLPEYGAISTHLRQIASVEPVSLDLFTAALAYCSEHIEKPLVLFIDEIDSLIGDSLLSVLRQLRAGFKDRPTGFPHSLYLIGLRDVRDYRIWSRDEQKHISASSPFNIKAESLLLANFDLNSVKTLYQQHSDDSKQVFTPDAIAYAYELTAGQPWLVNALAYQACYRDVDDPTKPITKEVIERAKEAIIKRRDTHLDSLIDKLKEPRVRPIIEAIITGETDPGNIQPDDLQYVRDLGLVRSDVLDIANPIYREIIPRELTSVTTELITRTSAPFINSDGNLNVVALLEDFAAFYRENSEIWLNKFEYREAGPHLLLMAFLQRVVNGGGTLQREYALGKRRVDILLKWRERKIVIELKIRYSSSSEADGLKQTAEYMDRSGGSEGHLILFDRDVKKSWDEKIFHRIETISNDTSAKAIHVWGL
jgi:hypothetical protein